VRRLARLDAAGYAALLAALARARGDDARAEGRVVVHGDGRRVRAHAPSRRGPAALAARVETAGVDAVATTRPDVAARLRDRGVAVVGPDAVARRLLYGVDRAVADDLARAHLDGPLDAPAPRSVGARVGRAAPAVGLLAVVVAAVALVGAGGGAAGDPTPVVDGSDRVAAESDGGSANETLAPGLTRAGVVDPRALADAHRDALERGPYEVRLTYREQFRRERAFPRAGRYRTVEVVGPTRYHETTRGWGDPGVGPVPVATREVYADGTGRFVRSPGENGTATRTPLGTLDGDIYASRGAGYVRRFLAVERTDVVETSVEDGQVRHRVAVRGTDRAGVAAYSATAVVTGEGLVRDLRVSYLHRDPEVAVSLRVRYDRGDGWLDRPSWVPANATADGPRVGRYPD
jgi:hypothetical protein